MGRRSNNNNSLDRAVRQIQAAFEQYLGRSISRSEVIRNHLSGGRYYAPVNVNAAINSIRNSPEARQRQAAPTLAPDPTHTDPPPITQPPTTPPPTTQPPPTLDPEPPPPTTPPPPPIPPELPTPLPPPEPPPVKPPPTLDPEPLPVDTPPPVTPLPAPDPAPEPTPTLDPTATPGADTHGAGTDDISQPTSSINKWGVQTHTPINYRKVLPSTREAGERERKSIYGAIVNQMNNPHTGSNERLRALFEDIPGRTEELLKDFQPNPEFAERMRGLYEGIPDATKDLVGDWRNEDYGLLGDARSRFATHGEGVGDDVKNRIAERGAGAIRGLHDDVRRNRDASFARNPYAVDSGLGLDTLGKTGQAFADNSRAASLEGEKLDQRAKEFGLSGISNIDMRRFDASEKGDERFRSTGIGTEGRLQDLDTYYDTTRLNTRTDADKLYRGLGTSTELGIRDRGDTQGRKGIDQLLNTYGSVHGPSAMEAGYDISRRGIDDNVLGRNQGIVNKDYSMDKGLNFQSKESALDRSLAERGQDKGVETATAGRAPWWSHLIPF